MVLYLIGLGLGNVEDLTIHAIRSINICSKLYIFASQYYPFNKSKLEDYLSRKVTIISPDNLTEKLAELTPEKDEAVALLIPGNPFCENYYTLIRSHCHHANVSMKIIHNASYLNAMGNTGIQLYKFGETVFMNTCEANEVKEQLKIVSYNLKQKLNTLIVFQKDDSVKLASELVAAIAQLDTETADHPGPSSKLVLLFEEDGEWRFDFGPASDLHDVAKTKSVSAVAVCSEFDCVEEEFLERVKRYHNERKTRTNATKGRGNFHLVGLGLGCPEDVTVRGRQLIEASGKVFLEGYTSIMLGGKAELEKYFGKEIVVADREMVEQNSEEILGHLKTGENVAMLVVGDPLGATTHADILLRALEEAEDVVVANNASIMNTIGLSGLKPSRFGGTVSIPFWSEASRPDSFYDKIAANRERQLHTLCLLDIQVKEQSFENQARGRKVYEEPRFMSTAIAAQQLLESKVKRLEEGRQAFLVDENTETVSLIRIGTKDEALPYSLLGELPGTDHGPPLHSLIIVGQMDNDERIIINSC